MATVTPSADSNVDDLTWAQGDTLNIASGFTVTVNTNQAKFWTTVNTSLSGGGKLYINNPGMWLLTMQAGGYVNCIAGDIGKTVVAVGSGATGVLVAYDNVQRIWTVRSANTFLVADACTITGGTGAGTVSALSKTGLRFLMGRNAGAAAANQINPLSGLGTIQVVGDWINIGTGTGAQQDFASPFPASTRQLTFQAGGYVACVPTDIGKAVVGGTSTTSGLLVSYDNINRIWQVAHTKQPYTNGEAVTITAGTGAGTINALAEGLGFDFIPCIWVETAPGSGLYEIWLNVTGEYGQESPYQRGNLSNAFGLAAGANRSKFFRQIANADADTGCPSPLNVVTTVTPNMRTANPVSTQFSSTLRFGEFDNLITAGCHVRIPNIIITDETRCDYYSTTAQLATRTQSANLSCTNGPKVYLTTCLFSESYCDFGQAQICQIQDVGFKIMPSFTEIYALAINMMGITVDPAVRYFYQPSTSLAHWVSRGGVQENQGTEYRWTTVPWNYLNNDTISNVWLALYAGSSGATTLGGVLVLSNTTGATFSNITIYALNKAPRGALVSYAHNCLHLTNMSGCTFSNINCYGGGIYWTNCVNNLVDGVVHSSDMFHDVQAWATPMRIARDPLTGAYLVNNTPYYFKVRSYHNYYDPTDYWENPVVYSTVQYSGHDGALPNHPFFFGGQLLGSSAPAWNALFQWANVNAAVNGSLPVDAVKCYELFRSQTQDVLGASIYTQATATTVTATDANALRNLSCKQTILVHQAGGYVACVAGDIGKSVVAVGSGSTGVLVAYDNTNRYWTVESTQTFAAADVCTIAMAGTGVGTVTSVQNQRNLIMKAAGYVNCVAGDIGRTVTGSVSGHTGLLVAYDNTKRIWTVATIQTFQTTDVCTCGGGTGVGTITTLVHLTLPLLNYVACVAADTTRVVTASPSGATGLLLGYDNGASTLQRVWTVAVLTGTFLTTDSVVVTAGTGSSGGSLLTAVTAYTNACDEYISCVASDIGKPVWGSTSNTYVGTLVSYDNTNRIWNLSTAVTFAAGDILVIVGGTGFGEVGTTIATVRRVGMTWNGYTNCVAGDIGKPVTGATSKHLGILISYDNIAKVWMVYTNQAMGQVRILTMNAVGYTNCVAGDIGKTVTGSISTHTGTLVAYDNATRIWTVLLTTSTNVFQVNDNCTIGTGTGIGVVNTTAGESLSIIGGTGVGIEAATVATSGLINGQTYYYTLRKYDFNSLSGASVKYTDSQQTILAVPSYDPIYPNFLGLLAANGTYNYCLQSSVMGTTWIYTRLLNMTAAGYVGPAAGDIGKGVVGGTSSNQGILVAYDNTTRNWWISSNSAFTAGETVTIPNAVSGASGVVNTTTAPLTVTANLGKCPQDWIAATASGDALDFQTANDTLRQQITIADVAPGYTYPLTFSIYLMARDSTRIFDPANSVDVDIRLTDSVTPVTTNCVMNQRWQRFSASLNPMGRGKRVLTMVAGGYVNCVNSDLGKTITGSISTNTGTLIAFDNANRIWTVLSTQAFGVNDVCTIGGGTGTGTVTTTLAAVEVSIRANANSTIRQLTSAAGGYVNCVLSDIGKPVVGSVSGHTGTLMAYDNTTRIWTVRTAQTYTLTAPGPDVLSITGGTGAGTVSAITPVNARIYAAMAQLEKSMVMHNEVETTTAPVQACGYQEINNITGWSADAGSGISFTLSALPIGTLWSDVFMNTSPSFTPSRANLVATTLTQDTPLFQLNVSDSQTIRNITKEGYGSIGNYFVYLASVTNSKVLNLMYDLNFAQPSTTGIINCLNESNNNTFSKWNLGAVRNLVATDYWFVCNNNSGPITISNIKANGGKIPLLTYWQNCILKKVTAAWPVTHPVRKFRMSTRQLTHQAGGYVNCVIGDIGKVVTGSISGNTGTLVAYNNTTRIWQIASGTSPYQVADVCTITAGTGVGTVSATVVGYTAAVAADLTRTIIGSSSTNRGVLVAFENSITAGVPNPIWHVRTLQTDWQVPVLSTTQGEVLTLSGGTGTGYLYADDSVNPYWNFAATPWANTTYGQTVTAASNKALYDEIFQELRFNTTKGAMLLLFNASALAVKPYTISAGTPTFDNNGALFMKTTGDQIWYEWPYKIYGVSSFTNLRPQFVGVDCGNNVNTLFSIKKEYAISTDGTTWGAWTEMTPENLSAESVSATNGFYLRIRLTQRNCVKYDTEANGSALIWGFTGQIGSAVTFTVSGASGTIVDYEKEGRTGTLVLSGVAGTPTDNNLIQVGGVTYATVNDATAGFMPRPTSNISGLMIFTERNDAVPDYPVGYVNIVLKNVITGSVYWVYDTTHSTVVAIGTAPGGDITILAPYDFDGSTTAILTRVRKSSAPVKYLPYEAVGAYNQNGAVVYVSQVEDPVAA